LLEQCVHLRQLRLHRRDALFEAVHLGPQLVGVAALLEGLADRLGQAVAVGLELLDLKQLAAALIQTDQLVHIEVRAPVGDGLAHQVGVFADDLAVQHGTASS